MDLPGSAGKPLVYLMYPQAETAEGRIDPFDPDNFKYEITVALNDSHSERVVAYPSVIERQLQ